MSWIDVSAWQLKLRMPKLNYALNNLTEISEKMLLVWRKKVHSHFNWMHFTIVGAIFHELNVNTKCVRHTFLHVSIVNTQIIITYLKRTLPYKLYTWTIGKKNRKKEIRKKKAMRIGSIVWFYPHSNRKSIYLSHVVVEQWITKRH